MTRTAKNSFFDAEALLSVKELFYTASNAKKHAVMTYIKNYPNRSSLDISTNCRIIIQDVDYIMNSLRQMNFVKIDGVGKNKKYSLNEEHIAELNEQIKVLHEIKKRK